RPEPLSRVLSGAFVLGLTFAATAGASTQFGSTFQMTYSAKKPNSSSGLETTMTWSDPGEPGGKPKALKKIEFRFHPGTRFDTKALRVCKASNLILRIRGSAAFHASARVDRDSINEFTGTGPILTVVY